MIRGNEATGTSGEIKIETKNLSLTNVAQVSASNFGEGNAGKVKIDASDTVKIDGNNKNESIFSGITSGGGGDGAGNAGEVNISTRNLFISDLAQIGAGNFKNGDGGTVTINASETISVDGRINDAPTSISSGVAGQGMGKGGTVNITTKNLSITNGAQIGSIVRGEEYEGQVTIGEGDAGKIKINASDTISVDGSKDNFSSSIATEVEETGKGNAGGVDIFTKKLFLTNGGRIGVGILGEGAAGDTGGDINLNFTKILSMRNGGTISAQANGDASGGNININSPNGFIVAFPNQNNDIIANAAQGQGGNIAIDVERVYGFDRNRIQQFLPSEDLKQIRNNGENDINSSSGDPRLSGSVIINNENLDPSKERVETPENIVIPDETAASACSASGNVAQGNSFTITGRGGMPPSPTEPLKSEAIRVSGSQGSRGAEEQRSGGAEEVKVKTSDLPQGVLRNRKHVSSDEIIPARGIAVNEKGQIVLTRYPTPNTSQRTITQSSFCPG